VSIASPEKLVDKGDNILGNFHDCSKDTRSLWPLFVIFRYPDLIKLYQFTLALVCRLWCSISYPNWAYACVQVCFWEKPHKE